MLILQVLSCLILGFSLTAAQNVCLDDRSTFFDPPGSKTTVTCADSAAGDTACAAKGKGYVCTPGTSGAALCCGIQVDCNADFVAKFDRTTGEFLACPDANCDEAGGFTCQNGMCCAPAQKPPANCNPALEVDVGGVCKPKANIGGACDDVLQCPSGSGATCDGGPPGVCTCPVLPAVTVNVNNVCMPQVALGAGPCVDTLQCLAGSCSLVTKKCECPANAIDNGAGACTACAATEVAVSNVCQPMKNIGQSCKAVQQCPAGAVCQLTCACPTGFMANAAKTGCIQCDKNTQVLVADVCYPKATFGAGCIKQEQCTFASGVCSGTPMTCQCVASTVFDGTGCKPCEAGKVIANNKCYDLSSYGAACEVDQQCVSYTNGICTGGQCACAANTALKGNACAACTDTEVFVKSQCLPKVPNGAACMYNEQCSYLNGACVNKSCGCTAGLQFSGTGCGQCDGIIRNNLCYPFAARQQACAFDEQCTKTVGTKCIGTICECPPGTTTTSTVSCNDVTNPPPAGTCKTGEIKINDQCYPLLPPNGFRCYFPQQCSGGSTCTDYVCKCPANMQNVVANQCTASGGGSGTCTGNTVSITGKGCVPKTNDGACLNVNCLKESLGFCSTYTPYTKCGYNAGQDSYFCCPQ